MTVRNKVAEAKEIAEASRGTSFPGLPAADLQHVQEVQDVRESHFAGRVITFIQLLPAKIDIGTKLVLVCQKS